MVLECEKGIIMNLKKINRLKLYCPIRQGNPYRKMNKATQENRTHPNIVNRNFNRDNPYEVILTDITYLKYAANKNAYLSVMLDGCTKEILTYKLSKSLDTSFVIETLNDLDNNHVLSKNTLVHSDQGAHYPSLEYQRELKKLGVIQSMSRRGNC